MLNELKAELNPAITNDVCAELAHMAPPHEGDEHKLGAIPFNPVTITIVEQVVSAGLDTAIGLFGDQIRAGVDAVKPAIRKIVSEQAVEFFESLVSELKDNVPTSD